jgi:hypothetical protein
LGTPFFQGISIFPWENELIYLGKMKITWENGVPKLAIKWYKNIFTFHACKNTSLKYQCSKPFYDLSNHIPHIIP